MEFISNTNAYKETSTLFNINDELKIVDSWLKEAVLGFRTDKEWRTGIFIDGDGQEYYNFPYIAGGAVTRSVLNLQKELHDYDVFFYHEFEEKFLEYIQSKYTCVLKEYSSLKHGHKIEITYRDVTFIVNLVTAFYGSEKEVLKNFDIDICKVSYCGDNMVYFHSEEVLNALNNRILSFKVTYDSESTYERLRKWRDILRTRQTTESHLFFIKIPYPVGILNNYEFFEYYVNKEGLGFTNYEKPTCFWE